MYELVHRYAPESPVGRLGIAFTAALVGLFVMVFGLVLSGQTVAVALLYLSITVTAFIVAGQLTRGLARQARAAPPMGRYDEPQAGSETETAVETLRRRYAEGELSHDEFQRRLDRLLETEELERTTADGERVFE